MGNSNKEANLKEKLKQALSSTFKVISDDFKIDNKLEKNKSLDKFDFLELKTYDYRFHTVRGPLTGWRASDSTIINQGTQVTRCGEIGFRQISLILNSWYHE